jgi:hypothetical protein
MQYTVPADVTATIQRQMSQFGFNSPDELLRAALEALEVRRNPTGNGKEGPSGESALDALSRHGLVGCILGGPPDVSTNPKYMEGFGQS